MHRLVTPAASSFLSAEKAVIHFQAIRGVISVKLTPSALEATREATEQKLHIDDFELAYSTKGRTAACSRVAAHSCTRK
jgi:ethanolamine utilization cobalamin adenosyltransferase